MSDKIIRIDEHVNKNDLELILEVNKKAIEIETEVADQNEEIIETLDDIKSCQKDIDRKLDALVEQSDEIDKELFKIRVLFITGLLSLLAQIIELFLKK